MLRKPRRLIHQPHFSGGELVKVNRDQTSLMAQWSYNHLGLPWFGEIVELTL